jgi:hypothetical protein
MTLKITFSGETENQLREKALASGQDVEGFVRQAVEDKLSKVDSQAGAAGQSDRDEWLARFDAWVKSHAVRPNVKLDDSRESIYSGRGE